MKRTNRNKMFWLYGATDHLINRTTLKLLDNYHPKFDLWRMEMGVPIDEMLVPIFPWIKDRADLIETYKNINVPTLVVGRLDDIRDPEIEDLYEGTSVIFADPPERDFHIDHMSSSEKLTWLEVTERKEIITDYLGSYFEQIKYLN